MSDINDFSLKYRYYPGRGDKPIGCGDDDCKFGVYSMQHEGSGSGVTETTHTPACSTCGKIVADLTDIFDPNEPRFLGEMPDCLKTAAAITLVEKSNTDIAEGGLGRPLSGIRGRRGALGEILRYAEAAGVEYDGDDLGNLGGSNS